MIAPYLGEEPVQGGLFLIGCGSEIGDGFGGYTPHWASGTSTMSRSECVCPFREMYPVKTLRDNFSFCYRHVPTDMSQKLMKLDLQKGEINDIIEC